MNTSFNNQGASHAQTTSPQATARRAAERPAWAIPQEPQKEGPLFTGPKKRPQSAAGSKRASRASGREGIFSRRRGKAASARPSTIGAAAHAPAGTRASAMGAKVAAPRRTKRPVGTTNLLKYAADNRLVRLIYGLTSGPRLLIFVLVATLAALAALYLPARDYYVAWRTNDILTQQLAIREKYNESLQKDVDAMFTQEGIEDAARSKLGLVQEGEKTITVTGGDIASDKGSASDEPSTSAEVERAEQAVMDDSPWYLEWLDGVFGFDGTGGMAVVSTGEK